MPEIYKKSATHKYIEIEEVCKLMVKIKRIKLLNYNRLFTGSGKKEVVIDFPDKYNIFIVKGQNGAGKSSLLSQINLLPPINSDGYEFIQGEIGEKEVVFDFNGTTYKVRYICKPNGSSHKCEAEIGKYEKGKFILLSQSSTIGETTNIIKELCGLDNKTSKLTALSVEDRGIVSMTSSERREFIQSISNIGDIKELVKTIQEKHAYYKKAKESNELKIASMPSESSLLSDKLVLDKSIADCDRKLAGIKSVVTMTDEELSNLKLEKVQLEKSLDDLNAIKEIIVEYNLPHSIMEYNQDLQIKIGTNQARLESLVKTIGDSNMELMTIIQNKDLNIDDLKKELDESEFANKKDCIYFESQHEKILATNMYNTIRNLIEDILSYVSIDISEVFKRNVDYKKNYNDILNKIDKINSEIVVMQGIKEENFVPSNKILEPSSDCVDTSCPLRLEFEKLIDKLEKYNKATESLNIKSSELAEIISKRDSLLESIEATEKINQIANILNDQDISKVLSKISPIFSSTRKFLDAMSNGLNYIFDDDLEEITYNTNLYIAYQEKSNLYEKLSSKYHEVDRLKVLIEKSNKELSEVNKEIANLEDKVIKTSKLNTQYLGMSRFIVESEIEKNINNFNKIKHMVETEERNRESNKSLESSINSIKAERDEYVSRLDKVKFNLELLRITQEELAELVVNEMNASRIKETLTKHLPIKVLRHIVLNLKDTSNSLLALTNIPYTIHDFTITAKEFTIKVQNKSNHISSDISKMSDGERSMLSLVTSLALNMCMLPDYSVITLDEMDATLSAENKQKFIKLINQFSIMKSLQIFMISHNEYSASSDTIGLLEVGPDSDFVVRDF